MKRFSMVHMVLLVIVFASLACGPLGATAEPDSAEQVPVEEEPTAAIELSGPADSAELLAAAASYYAAEYDDALAGANSVLRDEPDNVDALALQALVNVRRDSTAESGKEAFDRALELDENNAIAHAAAGWYAWALEDDYDTALAEGQLAAQLDPDLGVAYRVIGLAYLYTGELESSADAFTQALEREPDYLGVLFDRGWVYYDLGDGEAMLDDFQHILQLLPEDSEAFRGLGSSYELLGDYDAMLDAFDKAVQYGPNDPLAYWNRGYGYSLFERYDDAIADFTKVIELGEDDPSIYANRGLAYEYIDDMDVAISDYRTWVELDGENPEALNALAYTLAIEDRELDEALTLIDRALAVLPDDPFYVDSKAYILYKQGDLQAALPLFQQALAGGELYANYGLGLVYQEQGENALAIEAFTTFMEDHPDDFNNEDIQQRIIAMGG